MKKALSFLLAMLVMLVSTVSASTGEGETEAQEIDFSVLLSMPSFTMDYGVDDKPLWFSYEDQWSLVDENGCYVLLGIIVLETGLGDFMVLQLDAGRYATSENMIGIIEFSILVDELQYTFSDPSIWNDSTEEYGMILCGQDALAMLKAISCTVSPVHVVLHGEKESFAYEMTEAQQSVIQSLVENGEKAGLFSSEMALFIAQSFTPATVSAISTENQRLVTEIGNRQNASVEDTENSLQVDFSVFENLPGFATQRNEKTGDFAAYSINSDPLYGEEDCLFEPLIGSIMGVAGYAPLFSLSLAVDRAVEFIIHEAAFVVDGNRYTFLPSQWGNAELSNVFRISCGKTAQKMVGEILQSSEPIQIDIVGESETISFTMADAQKDALQTLYNAYLASGAATHEPTLEVAEALSPVRVKLNFMTMLNVPETQETAENTSASKGPVIQFDNGEVLENESIIIHSAQEGKEHYTQNNCFLEPVIVYDAKVENSELFYALAVGQDPSTVPPEMVTVTVDGTEYKYEIELSKGFLHLTYALIPCGPDELAMIDTLLRSENPATITIITKGKSVEFVVTEAQKELLKLFY